MILNLLLTMLLSAANDPTPLEQLVESGNLDQAKRMLETLDPEGPLHYWRGRIAFEVPDTKEAYTQLIKATEYEPGNDNYWMWLGRAYGTHALNSGLFGKLGAAKNARKAFEKAVELNPQNIEAHSGLVDFYSQAPGIAGGDEEKALAHVEAIRAVDPIRADQERAGIYIANEDYAAAQQLYRKAWQQHPEDAELGVQLAIAYHQTENWQAANEVLKAVTAAPQPDLYALYQLGRTGALSGEYLDDARLGMSRYIELAKLESNPPIELPSAYWRLSMILQHQGNCDDAEAALHQALAIDSKHDESRDELKTLKKKRKRKVC